jgi:hypothetical protein
MLESNSPAVPTIPELAAAVQTPQMKRPDNVNTAKTRGGISGTNTRTVVRQNTAKYAANGSMTMYQV